MTPGSAKIGPTLQKYFGEAFPQKIKHRKNPGTTLCIDTNYESDFTENHTYFIGEEVTSFDNVDKGLETLIIPAQNYVKFRNEPGPRPAVCIDMWKNIWTMSATDLGGERAYLADFEVYDERSHDQNNVTLDIYIGIR